MQEWPRDVEISVRDVKASLIWRFSKEIIFI